MINRIKIGTGSCGIAAGADEVLTFLQDNVKDIDVMEVGCIGHCYAEPLVEVETDEGSIFFTNVQADEASLQNILSLGEKNRLTFPKVRKDKEHLKVSNLAGRINPVSLEEYKANEGYKGLEKSLQMEPADVIEEVKIGGLRGRGGGGFPTAIKWSLLAKQNTDEKILICNADEGDPGAFMDRSLMESIPHQVMEGMLIAAHATQASQIFIYVRAEYPLAIKNLNIAINQIIDEKLNILKGREIKITIKEGAGAFVCGEETAMIHSLEGYRGIPRFRPPFPTDKGYKGYPSLINNVETFANVPILLREGGKQYAELGTEGSKGTKLFALAGDLKFSGIVEVPMGITIREVVYEIGGAEEGSVKAVQIGGPSGGTIPAEHFDTPIDYDSLSELGAIMGSGGLIVIGNNRCMVETARYFLDFTARESCGKCTFCRVGNVRLLETMEKITNGDGTEADIAFLEDLAPKIVNGSLCGLGKTAPNPVLSTLRFFKNEYLEHVNEKQCRALECNALVNVEIDKETCIECGACVKTCPVNAISDEFFVSNAVCTRCDSLYRDLSGECNCQNFGRPIMSKLKIMIDNREYIGNEGDTILDVAKANYISIPTLCHNEKISQTTSCFVCVVKDKKSGKYLPSCSARIADGMEIESESKEVFDMRQSALNLLLSEHSGDCEAPCTIACPAHAKVEEYVRAGKNGDLTKALEIIKERVPLPMSIGRVCPRFCEIDCRRNVIDKDEPVAINEFKRTAADYEFENYLEELPELTDNKVAIVGSGPAGYSAAYYLRREGIGSDIYERLDKPGGMLRYGIPEYRLPKAIVDKEFAHLEKMGGIKLFYNKKLGENLDLKQLKKEYDAVILAIGSWKPGPMYAEGEELAYGGIKWLEEIAKNDWSGENPGKTIVVGGGNTAMDCVRTSIRLGSDEVYCYYRRTEKEMPAEQIEIDEAREEGVQFKFLSQPVRVEKSGDRLNVTFREMKLGEPDASGRRRPVPIEGSEYTVEADTVIAAIGQKTIAPEGAVINKWKDIEVKSSNGQMVQNVFAAGDCVTGPATVVEAVAAGRICALGAKAYLAGEEYKDSYTINVTRGHWQSLQKDDLVYLREMTERKREKLQYISLEERKSTFKEQNKSFTKEQLVLEGERCLECSCTDRDDCALKEHSETYLAAPDAIKGVREAYNVDIRHPEIVLDKNKCIKCGTCVKICKEVVNESLLGFGNRGFTTNITTAFGEALPTTCSECGECIDACPTGALGWRIKK